MDGRRAVRCNDEFGLRAGEDEVADCTTDCRSETGVTVGLIDSLIVIARVLAQRDLSTVEAREALADLRADEDVARVLRPN